MHSDNDETPKLHYGGGKGIYVNEPDDRYIAMAKEVEKKVIPGSYEPDNVVMNYSEVEKEEDEDADDEVPDVVDIVIGGETFSRSKSYDPEHPAISRS